MRILPFCLAAPALGLGLALAVAAPTPPGPDTTVVKDRASFIPTRKFHPLGGTAVGVLVHDIRAVTGSEGRSGPPDSMGFSVAGDSYRWVYVPIAEKPLIQNLTVKIGTKGDRSRTYPSLSMASPSTVSGWGLKAEHALVEVEVNDGDGAPADMSFVATRMRRLDGTRDYPLVVSKVVAELQKKHQQAIKDREKAIDVALEEEGKKVLKGRKITGPRETNELMYLTWLPEPQRLAVHFRTRVSDGSYQEVEGGGAGRPVIDLLPPPPPKKKEGKGPALAQLPPPRLPPPRFKVRIGVTFGAELGTGYEVDRTGKVVRVLDLPIQTFSRELPPPPAMPLPPERRPD